MIQEYTSFLKAYAEVAQITAEYLPVNPDLEKGYGLTRKDFYEVLHEPRQISSKLLRELFTSKEQLMFLVGPRGSGKTTVGIRTVGELEGLNFYTLFLPIPRHDANKYLDDRTQIAKFLRDFIQNDMKRKLFSGEDTSLLQARFMSYLLCEDLPESSRPELYNTFFVNQQLLMKQYCQVDKLKFEDLVNWLLRRDHWFNEKIGHLRNELLDLAEITHLSHAIKYFFKTEGQIIWIDNVDAFEQEAQNLLINAIFSISATEPENIRFVVAAREENVLHFEAYYETQNSIQRSSVSIAESGKGENVTGFHMPVLPSDHFKRIVQRRLDFAREFQKKKEKEARDILANPLAHSPAQRMIAEYMLESFSPVLTDIRHKHLELLSEKILHVFQSERVLHLSNNNIRALLPMHCDFLTYLLEMDQRDVDIPSAFYQNESHLKTHLLYWMAAFRRDVANEFRCFNVVEHTRMYLKKLEEHPGCFLPFVTLSCLWNLCRRNRQREGRTFTFPTVRELVANIEKIDLFSEKEIKETILRLYDPRAEFTMFIAIESRQRLENIEQLLDNQKLRITYKGRAALSSLCNSFGFLLAMKKVSDGLDNQEPLDFRNMGKYFNELMPDLISMGEVHLESMNRIRQNPFFSQHENWFDLYLDTFGIPLEKDFSRSQKTCRSYGSEPRRVLYFDSMINSIESYAPNQATKAKLKRLIDEYARWLTKLEKGDIILGALIKLNVD